MVLNPVEDCSMSRRRHKPEGIVTATRLGEGLMAQGWTVAEAILLIGVTKVNVLSLLQRVRQLEA